MDIGYSKEDKEFRQRARAWLHDNVPTDARPAGHAAAAFDADWQRRQFEGGWAGVNWPEEHGGLGLSRLQQMIWYEESDRANAPGFGAMLIALTHAGPTLIAKGTEEQKSFHLRRILSGESVWCQGFSEPGAGSDLAALRTRAVVDGDDLVVSGSKIWTSWAGIANFQELLVRTDPTAKRHKGLTWVVCDMRSPGIDVQPIKSMPGEGVLNTVFYDDVRIPLSNVVGGIDNGWSVALSTLAFERGTTFLRDLVGLYAKVERVIHLASQQRTSDGSASISDIDRRLARVKTEAIALRSLAASVVSGREDGGASPKGSVVKILATGLNTEVNNLVMDILGPRALEYSGLHSSNAWTYDYLWGKALTIAGGTTEIQREIIADRVLGLPRAR